MVHTPARWGAAVLRFARRRPRSLVVAVLSLTVIGVTTFLMLSDRVTLVAAPKPGASEPPATGSSSASDGNPSSAAVTADPNGAPPSPIPSATHPAVDDREPRESSTPQLGGAVKVIGWLLGLAPTGGADTPEEDAYYQLVEHCRVDVELLPQLETTLYTGAAAACRAAFEGQVRLWPTAEAALDRVAGERDSLSCIGKAAFRVLNELVEAHREDPTVVFRIATTAAEDPRCPRLLAVTPEQGPAQGGTPVVLTGEHLPATATIHFGEVVLLVGTDGERATIEVPPAALALGDDGSLDEPFVTVWVEGWPGQMFGGVPFTYTRYSKSTSIPGTAAPEISSGTPSPSLGAGIDG